MEFLNIFNDVIETSNLKRELSFFTVKKKNNKKIFFYEKTKTLFFNVIVQ